MNKINFQKELDKVLADDSKKGSKLFLHSCCAPCSSYVLTYLSSFFDITVFYYNPNITDEDEYHLRVEEQKRLIAALNEEANIAPWSCADTKRFLIKVIDGDHDVDSFFDIAKGLEDAKEGGARCAKCFRLRLERTVKEAIKNNADFFATTLTISPLKNEQVINSIGLALEKEYCIDNGYSLRWLPSDFKKKEGYKHSIELSAKYNLYRQNFCGCEYSKIEAN